jgi:hypothetical protein
MSRQLHKTDNFIFGDAFTRQPSRHQYQDPIESPKGVPAFLSHEMPFPTTEHGLNAQVRLQKPYLETKAGTLERKAGEKRSKALRPPAPIMKPEPPIPEIEAPDLKPRMFNYPDAAYGLRGLNREQMTKAHQFNEQLKPFLPKSSMPRLRSRYPSWPAFNRKPGKTQA